MKRKNAVGLLSAKPDAISPFVDQTHILQEGNEATHNSEAEHGSVDGNAGSRVAVLGGAGTAARGTAAGGVAAGVVVGLGIVALAVVDTLDLAASTLLGRSELLELVARSADIVGTRNVKGALDIVQSREIDTVIKH